MDTKTSDEITQIQLSKKTREKLKAIQSKSESYDALVNKLINFRAFIQNNQMIKKWFLANYEKLGFDSVEDTTDEFGITTTISTIKEKKYYTFFEVSTDDFINKYPTYPKNSLLVCLVINKTTIEKLPPVSENFLLISIYSLLFESVLKDETGIGNEQD